MDDSEFSSPHKLMQRFSGETKKNLKDAVYALQRFREMKAEFTRFENKCKMGDYGPTHSMDRIERVLECRVVNLAMHHVCKDTGIEPKIKPVNESLSMDGYDKYQEELEESLLRYVGKALNKGQNCPDEVRAK